jgi:uncharacterized damage-inducible protein DinB
VRADDIRLLFDYSYAATARILDAACRLTSDEWIGPAPVRGTGSLRHILVHVFDTERDWREELRVGQYGAGSELDPEAFPDVATLARAWHEDQATMRSWLATLDDEALNAPAFNGRPLWVCLAHVVNHGTQHRSEAAMILTHWGQSPDDLDLTFYLRGWNDD